MAPAESRGATAAADATLVLLRKSFADLAAAGFEVDADTAAGLDRALLLFGSLAAATRRAHYERSRRSSQSRTGGAVCSQAAAGAAGTEGAGEPLRPGADPEEADFLAASLDGLQWDPKPVLGFLQQLSQARPAHRKRAVETAALLAQLSPTYRQAVVSDEGLAAWLGSCRSKTDPAEIVKTVSHGLASGLRSAAFDAAWHWACRCRRQTEDAERNRASWAARRAVLARSLELPADVTEKMLLAVWAAAEHCATVRFPEGASWTETIKDVFRATQDAGPKKDEFLAIFANFETTGELGVDLLRDLKWMIWNMSWHVANTAKGYAKDAREDLVRSERHLQGSVRSTDRWRGVNLGGWFLLEPGPCTHFWEALPPEAREKSCEWGACEALGRDEATRRLTQHRQTYFTRDDFVAMKQAGLTHVRLPFGFWCVAGPRENEPYVGPCLDQLDQALDDLEAVGMKVLLDLHGCPGGESDIPPCGHKDASWSYRNFCPEESLEVLRVVAERYAGRACVCAVEVVNEPSESFPAAVLAKYYEDAVHVIRSAGMHAGEVAVVLPIFTESRVGDFLALWEKNFAAYEDCVFDCHFYQCFGTYWHMLSLEGQMKAATGRKDVLKLLPTCCIGEWSLGLPGGVLDGDDAKREETFKRFSELQLEAYETATHGWFFWTWKDSAGLVWNLQDCLKRGVLKVPEA